MTLTLREAAGLTGKSKSTLARAIKAGRLSASRSTGGRYVIDPAELGHVDKRGSLRRLIVIQAGICNGDQLGTRPHVGRGMDIL